jgi:hypothetical protein
MATEQEQNRVKRIPTNRTNFFFRNLRESIGGSLLKVNVVRKRESFQCGERLSAEEIGGASV